MIVVRIQLEHHAEFRHIAQFFHRIIGKCYLHRAVTGYHIGHLTLADRTRRQQVSICYFDRIFRRLYFRQKEFAKIVAAVIFVGRVHAGDLPLCVPFRHLVTLVIVYRSSPEVRSWNFLDHFLSCVTVGNKSTFRTGEDSFKRFSSDTDVMFAADHFHRATAYFLFFPDRIDILSECHFMSCFRPDCVLFQLEGNRDRIFSRNRFFRKRQIIYLLGKRFHIRCHSGFSDDLSAPGCCYNTVINTGVKEEVLIDNFHLILCHFRSNILIVEFDFLHLWGRLSVTAVYNPVGTEIVIGRSLIKVAAVCLKFISIAVFFINCLVNVIPDKPSLIKRFCIRQIGILVHCPAGISHSVGILAADKRLAPVFCKEFLNLFHRCIHLAFHVAGTIVTAVMENTFIMYQSCRIFFAEELGHLVNILSSKGLISAGPDQNGRMVLVPLIHGIDTIQHHRKPFRFVIWHNEIFVPVHRIGIPASMALQIRLIDQIQPVFITKSVDQRRVRIMACPHCIDIVLFHDRQVFAKLFF